MPVFNEAASVEPSLRGLRAAFDAAGVDAQIVVVDDGSTDTTAEVLQHLAAQLSLTVVSQRNAGRFAARRAGLQATDADQVLLIDCGLALDPEAIRFVTEQIRAYPHRSVWNGDVTIVTDSAPAAFWKVATHLVWRSYLADRRLTSYTPAEFDHYPKGTGLFTAPRAWLLDAAAAFTPTVGDERLASDDTALIRAVATRAGRIWIAPGFGCRYFPRTGTRQFVRHAYFRGTTFVDGYLRAPGRIGRAFRVAALAGPPVTTGVLAAAVWAVARAPVAATIGTVALAAAAAVALARAVRRCGCSTGDAARFALMLPVFLTGFVPGALRGLRLAHKAGR